MKTVFRLLLVMVLLFAATALWANTGDTDADDTDVDVAMAAGMYNEAPMLAAKVAAGQLPPVEDRLPKDPYVFQVPEIGTYGGTLHAFGTNPNSWNDLMDAPPRNAKMMLRRPDGSVGPGELTDGFEWSADGNTLTIHIKEGVRWSDGDYFTTEDVIFSREDMHLNQEVGTWGSATAGAIVDDVIALDDLTFQVVYSQAFPSTILGWVEEQEWKVYAAHYFKPMHIDYNDDANEDAVAAGYENWSDRISGSMPMLGTYKDINRPTMSSFFPTQNSNDVVRWERNPYYVSVDQAGNQLPYVDEIVYQVVDLQTYQLKIASGEADWAVQNTSLDNYTLYKENEAAGGYNVTLLPGKNEAEMMFRFNMLSTDPVKGPILTNNLFRQALSYAIDRQEITDILYQGVAEPRQFGVTSDASFFKSEWNDPYYTHSAFDPALANKMLDGIGMTKRDGEGFRLTPAGQSFTLILEHNAADANMFFLVEEYWEAVGIKTEVVFEERALWRARRQDGLYDVMVEGGGMADEGLAWVGGKQVNISVLYFQPWSNWLSADWNINVDKTQTLADDYNGVMPGLEPPEWVKRFQWLSMMIPRVEYGSAEYKAYSQELYDIGYEQMWCVGTVGLAPLILVSNEGLGNVPEKFQPGGRYPFDLNWFAQGLFWK